MIKEDKKTEKDIKDDYKSFSHFLDVITLTKRSSPAHAGQGEAILMKMPRFGSLIYLDVLKKMLDAGSLIPESVEFVPEVYEGVFEQGRVRTAKDEAENGLVEMIDRGENPDILNEKCQDLLRIIANGDKARVVKKDNKRIAIIFETEKGYKVSYFSETTYS